MHLPSRPRATAFMAVVSLLFLATALHADDTSKSHNTVKTTVGGLLTDFNDKGVTIQIDDEDQPTTFLYDGNITKEALTHTQIFPVDRVNIKFKIDGDDKKLVSISKVPGKASGVVIGKVLKVYNNFWVAVKPNNGGAIEGFALNWPPEKFKQSHDLIKTLQPGDTVAIQYATDFERHRILKMELKQQPAK